MRIAFIAGGLEPGRDGVGDYTRTLAAECARRGHAVALLSVGEPAPGAGEEAGVLRLSADAWMAGGGAAARRWLEAFRPDWASLQFVPYSFDPRGLFGHRVPALAELLGMAPRRQVFFHETWIGSQQGASLKARVTGWRQRRAVQAMLRALAPACVHTSNAYYGAALATLGQAAGVIPVFGSVPPPVPPAAPETPEGVDPRAIVCGMFGTLHPSWEPGPFLADFAAWAQARGRPAALVAAGGLGYGAARFEQLAREWRGRVSAVAVGRCDEARLARLFARFDTAVTSVPWNILGKSSSAAALREHGIRVVVTSGGTPPRFAAPAFDAAPADDPGCVPYFRGAGLSEEVFTRTPPRPGVAAVAERFLADLDAAS